MPKIATQRLYKIVLLLIVVPMGFLYSMQKRVKVKPNSKQQGIKEEPDGSCTVHLKSPPVDGKANEELIKLLAERFDVPSYKVPIRGNLRSDLALNRKLK